jgi:hypothetical protein
MTDTNTDTTDDTTARDLPAELAADPRWRWLKSMGGRCSGQTRVWQADEFDAAAWNRSPGAFSHLRPAIDDPATQGCLAFSLLPEVWGPEWTVDVCVSDESVSVYPDGGRSRLFDSGGSLGANLALAFLAAPKREVTP